MVRGIFDGGKSDSNDISRITCNFAHCINSNRNTKYWRTSWFVHESWNVMNHCRKEKGILLFSPPKQRRQVNLFSKTNNWLAEVRFPILSPDRKMTITQMLGCLWIYPDWTCLKKVTPIFGMKIVGLKKIVGIIPSLFLLLGFGRVGYSAPRFTWSRNRSAAALSGRGPNKDPGFLKKNLSFSRDMLVSGRVMHQKRSVLQDLFVVCWIEQKHTVVTGCLMMDLF